MAWNGEPPLETTRKSLLNLFDFFDKVMLRVQYPREYPVCSRLNYCDRLSHHCASLAEEERKKERKLTNTPLPPSVSTCRFGTPAKLSSNANSLVAVENTRDVMVWLIKAYDYNQSRVLNVWLCTRDMGPPFFSRAIPTYGVLPYSMILH